MVPTLCFIATNTLTVLNNKPTKCSKYVNLTLTFFQAFFSDEFAAQNPEYVPHMARLKALFIEQVSLRVLRDSRRSVPNYSDCVFIKCTVHCSA